MIMTRYLKHYLGLFLLAVVFLAVETTADLMQPLLIGRLIDEGVQSGDLSQIIQIGSYMLLLTGVGMVGALSRNYISAQVSFRFARKLRNDLYEKLMALSLTQSEQFSRGGLMTRLTADVNMLQQLVNGMMRVFMKAPFIAIGSFIMVLNLDRRFLWVYLAILPLTVVIVFLNLKVGYPLYHTIQNRLDGLNEKTMAFLSGVRTVKAFDRFEDTYDDFSHTSNDLREITTKTMRIMGVFGPAIMLIINSAIVLVIYFGRHWVFEGAIGVGQIVAFTNYMTQFLFAISIISRVFNVFVKAKNSDERILEVLRVNTQWSTQNEDGLEPKDGGLTFKEVSFHYGTGEEAVTHLNFTIQSGEKIGILGGTGSGKTTLMQLINGLLQPTQGEILLGGCPMAQLSKKLICAHMGYVPQKTLLFSGTLLENLSFGKRDLPIQAYESVLEMAQAKEFVDQMPKGIHSKIGKDGVNLSGGQKQRVAIARALVHQPKILILDDSTSAVDVITESKIKQTIKAQREWTLILVGQKMTSVMDLDRIMIIENGKMTGFDTHEWLLAHHPYYQALYAIEFGGEVADA